MENELLTKGLVCIILVLLVGVNIVSGISINVENVSRIKNVELEQGNTDDVLSSDTFHQDNDLFDDQNVRLEWKNWWNTNWSYCKKIIINHTMIDEDLTNFPILFHNTSSDFSSHAQSDGDDFVFVQSNNMTTYNHEIERYDNTSGELIAWVNITHLSSTQDTILWLYYGNAICESQEDIAGTWDSHFVGVWHMDSSANGSGIDDSSLANTDWYMEKYNTPHEEECVIGYGQMFDGDADDDAFYKRDVEDGWCINLTATYWFNQSAIGDWGCVIGRDYVYGDFFIAEQASAQDRHYLSWGGNGTYTGEYIPIGYVADCWYFSGITRNNYTQVVDYWINDTWIGNDFFDLWVYEENKHRFTGDLRMGTRIDAGYWEFYGAIDELRISDIVRSESWIKTEYNTIWYKDIFLTVGSINQRPNIPIIIGLTNGYEGIEYVYVVNAIDPDGDDIFCYLDWGDGTNTSWIGPYGSGEGILVKHIWNNFGTYTIKAKAKDIHGAEGDWRYKEVTMFEVENNPPDAPVIDGPNSGKPNTEYNFTFNATDPDGHDVKYFINWGDNTSEWTDFYAPGTNVTVKHNWSSRGTYNITAIARDIHDAESPEATLTVNIPRARPVYHPLFQKFFKRFLNLLPILRYILGFQ